MPKQVITQYAVDELVDARKIAWKTRSVASGGSADKFVPLLVELCRADARNIEIGLLFEGRTPRKGLPGVPSVVRPSASLLWHGERIRGIDWTIKHEITKDGVPTGDAIRGWHEHYWTTADGCSSIRVPSPVPQNEDLSALITWCCKQWNIEGIQESMRLFS
jgi:hypothetical protein